MLQNGDLLDAITSTSKYTERDAAVMIFNLALAVNHLHSLNIAHRDIKLENVLVKYCYSIYLI
jgi:serine/threonine protein kinase